MGSSACFGLLALICAFLFACRGCAAQAQWLVQEIPNILRTGQDILGSLINDTVHHTLLDTLAANAVEDAVNGVLSESEARIRAKFHPSTPFVPPQTTLPSEGTTMPQDTSSTPLLSTLPPSSPPQTSTQPRTSTLSQTSTQPPTSTQTQTSTQHQTATVPPSSTPMVMTSTPLQTTTIIPSTLPTPTPAASTSIPQTTILPSTTLFLTTPVPSTTPFAGTCQDVIGINMCYINATVTTATVNTSADQCADPVTCQCTPTSTDTVCSNSTGLCVDTPTSFKQCGLYQSCATAPVTLGFEDAPLGTQSIPFSYGDLDFSASGSGSSVSLVVVDTSTQAFPEVVSGQQALQGNYPIPAGASLQSFLSVQALGSPIVAFSAYVNGRDPSGTAGLDLEFALSYNSTIQPDCFNGTVSTPGPNGSPVKVSFGSGSSSCIVDYIVMGTFNQNTGVAPGEVDISIDDLVVCNIANVK